MPITIATFNVKDLFDAEDDVSAAMLEAKLDNLARFIEGANPDVLALQEVGGPEVLARLTTRIAGGADYAPPIVGTGDKRGIRCAIVTRLPVIMATVHTAERLPFPGFVVGDPEPFGDRIPLRRGIVHARLDAGALGPIDVLVAHFKSKRGVSLRTAEGDEVLATTAREYAERDLRSLVQRAAEALYIRGVADELLTADPRAKVCVAGDLNDTLGSVILRIVSGGGPAKLHPCSDKVPIERRYSALHGGSPAQIDHLLVSEALYETLSSASFANESLRDHGMEIGPPTTDSDHALFAATFEAPADRP